MSPETYVIKGTRLMATNSGVKAMWKRFVATVLALLMSGILPASASAAVEYYHLDALGSVRVVTDQAGVVTERHDYLPYGEECTAGPCASNPQAGVGQPKKFTGKERDIETGLDYFQARYYGAKGARFTSSDSVMDIEQSVADPQRWNRYAYSLNNPLGVVDPDGRQPVWNVGPMAQTHDMWRAGQISDEQYSAISVAAGKGLAEMAAWAVVAEFLSVVWTAEVISSTSVARTGLGLFEGAHASGAPIIAVGGGAAAAAEVGYVVRAGIANSEHISKGIVPHRDIAGLRGFSAQGRAGKTVEELAATGGKGGGPFPHGKVSVTTGAKLRCIGCKVVPSRGGGLNHVTVAPGSATAEEIASQFRVVPNPGQP